MTSILVVWGQGSGAEQTVILVYSTSQRYRGNKVGEGGSLFTCHEVNYHDECGIFYTFRINVTVS